MEEPMSSGTLSNRSADGERGQRAAEAFEQAGGDLRDRRVRDLVATLGEHAPALLPLALGDVSLPADVLARPLERRETEETLRLRFLEAVEGLDDGPELRRVLRRLRHRTLVRIALREILRLADVDETSAEMAALAAAAMDAALAACRRPLEARYGQAVDGDGQPVPLVVLGMGKLGGRELNLGSDVDVCFFYGTDEATVGDGDLTVHELYTRVATRTVKALSDVTEDGFCFRVDLRLRPEGSRGPLVNSLASTERYYESFGRTWERAALLRAEPIAGDWAFGEELLGVLRPFVFRRAVDPGIAREMADMLKRSRRELDVDPERDVKLGRGGIREAEFFVQALQLIWGGRHPELQVRGTVEALQRLRASGLVTPREAEDFGAHWALLRRVEHRIHVWAGYQTHALPPPGEEREAFARSLGFRSAGAMERTLRKARDRVAELFDSLFEEGEPEASRELDALLDFLAGGPPASEVAERVGEVLPVRDPDEAAAHLLRMARHATSPLGPVTRERSPDLGAWLLQEAAQAADPDMALRFLADFFTRMGGPLGYDRVFLENPTLIRRMVGLFGASGTLSSALVAHPEEVDEALVLGGAPALSEIRAAHQRTPIVFDPREPPHPEAFVAALRRVKREVVLQVGVAYVNGEIELADVEERLSALAEAQIAAVLEYARAEAYARFGRPRPDSADAPPAEMVVVGMGKLGGGELGFGGDLDVILLYGADGQTEPPAGRRSISNAELFTRIGQRILRLLSQPDAEGPGYETDARLRPSGSQGMLVVSLRSFDHYHETRAAPWERQALLRARPVAGDDSLARMAAERFERLAYGGEAPPAAELAAMRARIQQELSGERFDRYHPKAGYGGLVDVEFVVQWLQMRHGDDPRVRCRGTLDALRGLREAGRLDRADADALEEGWTFFRRVEQALKLLDETREAVLPAHGAVPAKIARRLGFRDRDGMRPREVLLATWRMHAEEVRTIFERVVAPVGVEAPWSPPEPVTA
ncbi:MAG: bifunctional [glutamate--ammonia ligase]-adenylyl-L-tyrosine phosphorylase/[glutamate--ammonia-ligase] adenylyltransferase [Myxococcota bacterium]